MALGIGSGVPPVPPVDEESPDFLAPARPGGTWSFSERRATRGLLTTTVAFAAGGLATWALGQGDEPPVTGSPLVVVNTHLWAGALTLGAVSGVQIAQASRTP
ncbi:MAG: hypothetical protein H0V89_11105 [Deltaproteobacteria bacterium]|nr:hypothetical protein [Deltaproteobacteria bacterium]